MPTCVCGIGRAKLIHVKNSRQCVLPLSMTFLSDVSTCEARSSNLTKTLTVEGLSMYV